MYKILLGTIPFQVMAMYIQISIVMLDATQALSLMTCCLVVTDGHVYSLFVSYVLPEDEMVIPKHVIVK